MNKSWDLSLIVGRFQGLHAGHVHLIETALSVSDRVLILIGSAQEHGTILNPFSATSRQNHIKSIFPQENIIIGSISDLNDEKSVDSDWGWHLLNTAKQYTRKIPDVYIYGQEDKNLNWLKMSNGLKHASRNMTEIIIPRDRFNISGTTLREWMVQDNFDKFLQHTHPKLHKLYPKMREELMSAPEISASEIVKPLKPWSDKDV